MHQLTFQHNILVGRILKEALWVEILLQMFFHQSKHQSLANHNVMLYATSQNKITSLLTLTVSFKLQKINLD